jgi:hypothetical protein
MEHGQNTRASTHNLGQMDLREAVKTRVLVLDGARANAHDDDTRSD